MGLIANLNNVLFTVIQPTVYESDVRSMIVNLPDLSVSRSEKRLQWGIPVPNDDSQKVRKSGVKVRGEAPVGYTCTK